MNQVWKNTFAGFLVLASGFVPYAALAQVTAQASGYLEHQFSVSVVDRAWTYLDYDRFRVDVKAKAGKRTQASAGVIWQLYRGDTRLELRDFLPDQLDSIVDSSTVELEDRHYLNHAFIVLRPGRLELTAGKQYLSWGASWVFNPTELFRPKNVLEPTYEREGIGAISLKVPFGTLSDVRFAFVPDGGFETSGKLIRLRHHIAGFDVSALTAVLHESEFSHSLAAPVPERRQRVTFGGDITGEILGLGVWAEGTWSDHTDRQWIEATVGGNYTLENGTLLLLEGYYNGRGQWQDPYPADLWLNRLTGGLRSLGKGQIYAHASRLVGQLWTVGFSTLGNVGDKSFVLIPSIAYAFAQDVDVLFNGLAYVGGSEAEFGGERYGAFLRARVYF